MAEPMRVLVVEPYYGGSHRAFIESLRRHSRHEYSLATLPARHWKWRMRSAPLAVLEAVTTAIVDDGIPDAVLCTDMLDLPTWLGLIVRSPKLTSLLDVPVVAYFHENQWAYPTAPDARVDHHYGYTNLLTAIAADAVWFNSEFNSATFLEGSRQFLRRMPDAAASHDLEAIQAKSAVIAPGFEPCTIERPSHAGRLRIGWVGRFEHDKRPDRFLRLLELLVDRDFEFELILLGPRDESHQVLHRIRECFAGRILFDGFAEGRDEYWCWLSRIDVVVSTADHEFFGIAVCEAISAGAVPITPNGLSYVEYVPAELRYDTLDESANLVSKLGDPQSRQALREQCRRSIAGFESPRSANRIDTELVKLVKAPVRRFQAGE